MPAAGAAAAARWAAGVAAWTGTAPAGTCADKPVGAAAITQPINNPIAPLAPLAPLAHLGLSLVVAIVLTTTLLPMRPRAGRPPPGFGRNRG